MQYIAYLQDEGGQQQAKRGHELTDGDEPTARWCVVEELRVVQPLQEVVEAAETALQSSGMRGREVGREEGTEGGSIR